ncbi:MAG TPA: YidB family protein [Candidatus Saccharimonadia bacterium]|nr:YidB family protein [Candidatus Saccharimonadia bacterium]
MGLLDDLGKEVLNKAMGGSAAGGATEVNWLQLGIALLQKFGGLDGLMAKFQEKGLGDLIASWVGTGQNKSISADQIMEIFGKRNVQDVAAQAGTDAETAAGGIADVLPGLVDKLTPDGQPVGGDVLQQGIQALLGGKLGDLGKLFG